MPLALVIPDHIHHELQNWARWCWSGPLPHPMPATQCGSLEAGYRAPPQWDGSDERRQPVIRPNDRHARLVQASWEQMTGWPRIVLKAEYPAMLAPRQVLKREEAARSVGLSVQWYEHHLAVAVAAIEEAIGA